MGDAEPEEDPYRDAVAEQFRRERAEVWVRAWEARAGKKGCHYKDEPARWADECLKDYEKRFLNEDRAL